VPGPLATWGAAHYSAASRPKTARWLEDRRRGARRRLAALRRPVEEEEKGEQRPARCEDTAVQRLTRSAAAHDFGPWQRRGARTQRSERRQGGRGIGPGCQGGAQGEAMVDFEQGSGGGAARTWETVLSEWEPASKYPCGARPDSAAHDSQLGCGAGRQCL
jgi:hypothetical protein